MVTIEQVRASNAQIATHLGPGLVAVFVGATNGVGEVTVRQWARHALRPRVYLLGRSEEAGERIVAECRKINAEGEFTFISKDLSLLSGVDEVCREILARESQINLLFLTIGTLQSGMKTAEGLHYPAALAVHSRNRFILNLLPAIRRARPIRRVVSVFLGAMEGPTIDLQDLQGFNMSLWENKGHAASLTTLSLEWFARDGSPPAPEVSFIHDFPGAVKGGILRGTKGLKFGLFKVAERLVLPFVQIPPADAGDRQVYFATSARYPSADGAAMGKSGVDGVPLPEGLEAVVGSDGQPGVYSVFVDGEALKPAAREKLDGLRKQGMRGKVWEIIEKDMVKITGSRSI